MTFFANFYGSFFGDFYGSSVTAEPVISAGTNDLTYPWAALEDAWNDLEASYNNLHAIYNNLTKSADNTDPDEYWNDL